MKSSQVKKIKKSKLNKQMQKSRNGNGKALVCCRYFGESACKSVFSVSQEKRLGRYL